MTNNIIKIPRNNKPIYGGESFVVDASHVFLNKREERRLRKAKKDLEDALTVLTQKCIRRFKGDFEEISKEVYVNDFARIYTRIAIDKNIILNVMMEGY